MAKDTSSVNGKAMPKFDRRAIMRRAWEIFRETYKYPLFKFADIGRKCFAWALRQAWIEAREAARIAAVAPVARADRIEALQALIARASFIDSGPLWKATLTAYRDEIRHLQAA